VVQSHLIQHGFVKDYTFWKYHGKEADPISTAASGENLSTMNDGGQQPSASTAITGGDSANHDYISIHDPFEYMADNDGGGRDGEQIDVLGPKDVEIFQNIANRMDKDDVLFENLKWLENFKKIKQAAIDLLYKGCLKHWTALHFNL
jgi:hypothetical protein